MKKRVLLDIDEKLNHKLNTMEIIYGLEKGQIVEIALKRSIQEIENSLKDLIPVDVQGRVIESDITQKNSSLVDQTEGFILEIEDSLRKPMSSGVKISESNISSSELTTIELHLSKTDVKNKHLTIPTRYLYLFPLKLSNCRGNHDEERDKMFSLIDGNAEYRTHIEGANRLPHITGIFHDHPELQPKDKVYIDILEPKKYYRFRTC